MTGNAGSAGGMSASWQGLAQLPQMITEVRASVLSLRTLISTPRAAFATGSPLAGAAVIALGAELLVFLHESIQALDDDIDALRGNAANYQQIEADVAAGAQGGTAALAGLDGARSPSLDGGVQSTIARGALTVASGLDDVADGASWVVDTASGATRTVLGAGEAAVRTTFTTVAGAAEQVPWVGDGVAAVSRGIGDAAGDALGAVGDGVGAAATAVGGVADQVAAVGHRAEDLRSLRSTDTVGAAR